jgi:hypothetical protein
VTAAPTDPPHGRLIVSDSRLLPLLAEVEACLVDPDNLLADPIVIDVGRLNALADPWSTAIARQATALAKYGRGNLERLATGCLYDRLDEPDWRRAALVCEVFRHPDITKNAGWLDTRRLQAKLASALEGGAPLRLAIGWGQAKREAGGMKTFGPMPDLAEVFAISRLAILRHAILQHLPAGSGVQIEILSGARRFERALFTRRDVADAYEDARRRIAELFSPGGGIVVRDFVEQLATRQQAERDRTFERCAAAVRSEDIASQLGTIALNVDWTRFFNTASRSEEDPPFGITMPREVAAWLSAREPADARRLVRAAITCVINPRCRAAWSEHFGQEDDTLDLAVEHVRAVAWEAARAYIALQEVDRRAASDTAPGTIRLSVQEKRDRPEIPAIFTLSPQAGNQLSQHVVAMIGDKGELRFGSVVEFALRARPRPIVVTGDRNDRGPFAPLIAGGQPLALAWASEEEDVMAALAAVLDA